MKLPRLSRRQLLQFTGVSACGLGLRQVTWGAERRRGGRVIGQPAAERVGEAILAEGGNAADAIVAAALTAAVAAPSMTGIGGYGLAATLAMGEGRRIVCVDGNSQAPAQMPRDLFLPKPGKGVPEGFHPSNSLASVGWQTAGVPGILAGLQLILDSFGTQPLRELVQPAIELARDGIPWGNALAGPVKTHAMLRTDPGSKKLYTRDGEPLPVGSTFKNPELAELLQSLAKANSVEPFYRGDIAARIAEGFARQGGWVTTSDLASYQAKLVEPLNLNIGDHSIYTAPLTAGGLTTLQLLHTLKALDWSRKPAGVERTHLYLEALRLAWRDRLTLLGDPDFGSVPFERLLSADYARESASRVETAVQHGKFLAHQVTSRDHTGTIHLNAADAQGNFAAVTLTHGNGFGACVTVPGLGLTLGHGMSRFDPHPDHPNGPAPGKRPMHNMVPTIVTRDGQAVLAVGGTGGRKIPCSLADVLTQHIFLGQSLEVSIAAPRLTTEGGASIVLEKSWPAAERAALTKIGYTVGEGTGANMSGIAQEQGELHAVRR